MESQLSNTKRFDQELRLVSYSGIIFFLQYQACLLSMPLSYPHHPRPPPASCPCPCLPAACDASPAHLAVLTLPFPQDQFLCLAVQEGKLALLYDFGAGLKEADPLQRPPPQLTATSKAVRPGPEEALGGEGQWGSQLL